MTTAFADLLYEELKQLVAERAYIEDALGQATHEVEVMQRRIKLLEELARMEAEAA